MKKRILGPKTIIIPLPAALVVSGTYQQPNVATIAWITVVGHNPPMLCMSLGRKKLTYDLIVRDGCFTVNLPSSDIFIETDYCGITKGHNTNKFEDTGLTLLESTLIDTPIIAECPVNHECTVERTVELENNTIFIGRILETHISEAAMNQEGSLDPKLANPLIYMTSIREYYTLGEKLGDAYSVGRKIEK